MTIRSAFSGQLRSPAKEPRLIIFTGGLGPTPDDLTMASLAEFFDAPLVENPAVVVDLEAKFARRGRQLNAASRRQAQLPAEADVLPNPVGTAPGVIWEARPGLLIMTFPGVPHEMKAMWQATAAPLPAQQRLGQGRHSQPNAQILGDWRRDIGQQSAAPAGFRKIRLASALGAGEGEVKLRISAKAESVAAANALIDPVAREIRKISGNDCYGADDDTLASTVGRVATAKINDIKRRRVLHGGWTRRVHHGHARQLSLLLGWHYFLRQPSKAGLVRGRCAGSRTLRCGEC